MDNNYNFSNDNDFNFHKERDFGELIGTPFYFIRQEFKNLSLTLIKFAGPALAVFLLIFAILRNNYIQNFDYGANPYSSFDNILIVLGLILFIGLFIFWIVDIVLSYITLYAKNGRYGFEPFEVFSMAINKFFPLFGTYFLFSVTVFVGFIILYIPGIILGIYLSFVFNILFYENTNSLNAFKRSMFLVQDNWWFTFGLYFVFGIIVSFVVYFIFIFIGIGSVAMLESINSSAVIISIVLVSVLSFFTYIYLITLQISLVSAVYFSILIKKEGNSDIYKKIETIISENDENIRSEENIIFSDINNDETQSDNKNNVLNIVPNEDNNSDSNRFTDTDQNNRFKY